jgi:cation-transporting P-type ATPase E
MTSGGAVSVGSAEQRRQSTSVAEQFVSPPAPSGDGHEPGDAPLPPTPVSGLTEAEAARRRAAGQGNDVAFATSRSFGQIVRDNAFMSINVIIFVVGVVLLAMGLVNDAIVTVALVLMNVVIAVFQEWRAKVALDRIALLARLKATVIRDGQERQVDQTEIVLGDLLTASAGDQVMVDGHIVASDHVALDEALLTGESDAVSKAVGEPVYSGSFVVSGRMTYEAERVGAASRANRLTAEARVFQTTRTPAQREIDLVLRVMVLLILMLGGPIVLDLAIRLLGMLVDAINAPFAAELNRAYQGYSVQESVRAIAVVVGLVPQGIALMLTVTYAMGAIRLAGQGALLQQANAIESLSHVDTLCLDKTGTLTTNALAVGEIEPINASYPELVDALAAYAACATSRNTTIEALADAFPAAPRPVRFEIPFSSARKWSAIAVEGEAALVLGAPDVLLPRLDRPDEVSTQVAEWAESGLRVILLARVNRPDSLRDGDGEPCLPERLTALGLVSFRDELQPDVAETLEQFRRTGIGFKIISGDHPETVAALVRQAGFDAGGEMTLVSGIDLAGMSDGEFADAAEQGAIFGRITPEQKLALIRQLQQRGHYVAMIGDGINDVLALKQAEVGIAMKDGAQATRAVADMVLLGNRFGVLPAAFREGRRIIRSLQDLLKLFLTRSLSITVTILGAGIVGAAFPVIPTQNVLPALLGVGVPALVLAMWRSPGDAPGGLLRNVLPFTVPAFLTIGMVETMVYVTYARTTADIELAQTVLTAVAVLCGLLIVLFVRPPSPIWASGAPLASDWRVPVLVALLAVAASFAFFHDGLRDFFMLAELRPFDFAVVLTATTAWAYGIHIVWRHQLLRRLLGLDRGTINRA